ncbi:hypothetical protein [Tissierella pigra]|uniref:hypothetical protein n=1 Tax=Tissierella pigra TaxID=2607614 RepID=UPI0018A6CD06|nr:hypothetical protein [Tissierella pigra]
MTLIGEVTFRESGSTYSISLYKTSTVPKRYTCRVSSEVKTYSGASNATRSLVSSGVKY